MNLRFILLFIAVALLMNFSYTDVEAKKIKQSIKIADYSATDSAMIYTLNQHDSIFWNSSVIPKKVFSSANPPKILHYSNECQALKRSALCFEYSGNQIKYIITNNRISLCRHCMKKNKSFMKFYYKLQEHIKERYEIKDSLTRVS